MSRITILHFTKVINRNDFIDIIVKNADSSRFRLLASTYQSFSNIEDPKYKEEGVPYFVLNINHSWADIFIGAWRLSRLLKSQKVDILHTHHYYEAIIGRLACWLYRPCRHIVGRHYHNQLYLTTRGFKLWYYLKAEAWVNHFADLIVVPSSAIARLLADQGVSNEKVQTIPYGFNFESSRYTAITKSEQTQLRREFGWDGKWLIGNIARHDPIKGQVFLIQAFQEIAARIPQSMLVMVGDGPSHTFLKQHAKKLGLESRVLFLGWRRDAHRIINAMDIVVHPTLQEAFPQLMVEAMALGKPLLITPVSGVTDVIEDDVNGILIPCNESAPIVEAVTRTFDNPLFAQGVGREAAHWVRNNLHARVIIPKYESVYARIA